MATSKKSTSKAKKSALVTVNKVALSAEREQQLAEWQQREAQQIARAQQRIQKLNAV